MWCDNVPISSGFPHATNAEAYENNEHNGGRQEKELVTRRLTVIRYHALGPREIGTWFRTAAKSARVDVMAENRTIQRESGM